MRFMITRAGKSSLTVIPRLSQGDDVIAGKIITYFVNEQKSVVTGGTESRVEAVIHPKEKVKSDGSKP